MAEPSGGYFDIFLKVWAIVGPLIAAVASALWSRYIQNGDRNWEHTRDKVRQDREREARIQEHNNTIRKEKYAEVKSGLADFLTSSNEYVRKMSDYMTNPLPERHQAATAANDKFAYSCQIVKLLGNDQISNAATAFWNATFAIPISYSAPQPQDYEEKLHVFRNAQSAFTELAREFLRQMEAGSA